MKKNNFYIGLALFFAAAMMCSGCRQSDVSASERADRASRHYTAAMAELQAGRVDSAIQQFQNVVKEEPANGNAHFQLAALLEDVKKDYLGAIIHYRLYCMIRPDSEKAVVALDRLKGCETRYASDVMTKAGVESRLAKEFETLRAEHEQCGKKLAKAREDLESANRKIAGLQKTIDLKSKMLERAESVKDADDIAIAPKKNLRPTDTELLDEGSDAPARVSSDEIKKLKAMLDEDERTSKQPVAAQKNNGASNAAANNPFMKKTEKKEVKRLIPETYTVEDGDTLMRISTKFYGTNRKWREIREANKTVISSDGRVRAGQVIKLP